MLLTSIICARTQLLHILVTCLRASPVGDCPPIFPVFGDLETNPLYWRTCSLDLCEACIKVGLKLCMVRMVEELMCLSVSCQGYTIITCVTSFDYLVMWYLSELSCVKLLSLTLKVSKYLLAECISSFSVLICFLFLHVYLQYQHTAYGLPGLSQ